MLERLTPAWRNAILIVLGILSLWFFWSVRTVLNPLIAAYFLAYVVHPMVVRLERRGFSRKAAVNVIFIGALLSTLLLLLVLFLQGRGLVREVAKRDGIFTTVETRLDRFVEKHEDKFQWLLDRLEGGQGEPPAPAEEPASGDSESGGQAEIVEVESGFEGVDHTTPVATGEAEVAALDFSSFSREVMRRLMGELGGLDPASATQAGKIGVEAAGGIAHFLAGLFGSFLGLATFLFLLPIYTWFLLFELGNIHAFLSRYLPSRDRERFSRIGRQIGEVLANFFRGRLLVALLKGVYMAVFLWAVGIDYPALIGLGSGFLSLIPFVGALVGGIFAFAVANLSLPLGPALLWVLVIFVSAELIEGYILVPKVIGDSLGLPPLVVLFSVFLGGAALGVFGLLLALPLTASLVILVREFVLPALADLADES